LPQLQAERQLARIEAASVPHMKDPAAVIRRHLRAASDAPAKRLTAVEALTQAGIPIVRVPKGGEPA